MKLDIISIFPEFFDALDISLLGKARAKGLLEVNVHDLRDAAHDKHRTVDGPPAGGGAGMVMRPEPWGETLDGILDGADDPIVIFPSPAGDVFTQEMAKELAQESHIVFGCGRFEGIDQRVFDETASRARTRLVSIGDYVLNGGEVAVTVMIEAIGRLVPGVIGNPDSLVEESHENGLLEYPSYTKPASWRDREIPAVLLSGNHGAVDKWRHEQQVERTRRVRPELLPEELRAEPGTDSTK